MKIRIIKTSYVIISAIFIFISSLNAENIWETVKDENGIQVATRAVEGSAIREFRAVTTVQCRISSLLAMLADPLLYPKWIYRCSEARIVEKKNYYERLTYSVTKSPWPVEDRDVVVKSVISQNKKTGAVTVSLKGVPGYVPAREGKVRMTAVRGYWLFEPAGKGWTKVTYRLHSEPGGSIPEKLVNSSLVDIPYNTLYNMRKLAPLPPYRDASYAEIVEK